MDKIYYISQGITPKNHLNNIKNVCEIGCKLVQLRLKNTSLEVYISTAFRAKEICNKYDAKLIINDNINVVKQVNTDGIHLGKDDINPLEARNILGNILIGGTANTYEDCINLINQKVDYIGLGPFRFTKTKNNLSPILGIKGYKNIISKLKKDRCFLPIYAIGGIKENDIEKLYKIGIYGIAVSGLLTNYDYTIKQNIEVKTERWTN